MAGLLRVVDKPQSTRFFVSAQSAGFSSVVDKPTSAVFFGLKPEATGCSWYPINPFRTPEPLPILHPSSFVPRTGFPVVKGL